MTCGYCGTHNGEGERRCRRCGRKPGDTLNGEFSLQTDGALAAAVETASVPPQVRAEASETALRRTARPIQASLFHERPASNVIPFEAYAPVEPPPRRPRAAPQKPRRRVAEEQGTLDFLPSQPAQPRTLSTTVEAVIYCEAPVATTLHRGIAAALDWSMVLIGYGLFLGVFQAAGGEFVLTRTNLLIFGGMLPLLGFAYGLMWAIVGGETAGMRWMRLRLTTFDGFRPEPRQRLLRFLGSCLSACTVLGMLWPLADEESLAWQDHISHTFPTPCVLDQQVFRRV
jgi:uncharacterized RDD family membrane protein YckC